MDPTGVFILGFVAVVLIGTVLLASTMEKQQINSLREFRDLIDEGKIRRRADKEWETRTLTGSLDKIPLTLTVKTQIAKSRRQEIHLNLCLSTSFSPIMLRAQRYRSALLRLFDRNPGEQTGIDSIDERFDCFGAPETLQALFKNRKVSDIIADLSTTRLELLRIGHDAITAQIHTPIQTPDHYQDIAELLVELAEHIKQPPVEIKPKASHIKAQPIKTSLQAKSPNTLCPFCRDSFQAAEQRLACDVCGTEHHQDCFVEAGSCTVFGCKGSGRVHVSGARTK